MDKEVNRFSTSDGIEYEVDKFGVIHQLNPQPYNYNEEYIDTYRKPEYRENSAYLQGLRLGHVLTLYRQHLRCNPHTLLDYGYGDGSFLKLASESGLICSGLDVTGEPLPEGCLHHNPLAPVDIVTFWDVYEHLNTIEINIDCKMVVMSMPNVEGKDFETWKHRKPNEHLHHFTTKSLQLTMLEMGWTCISVTHIEDIIRKGEPNNIMTLAFVR